MSDLASSAIVATQTYLQLMAGDSEVVTEEGVIAAGAGTVAKYTVLGRISASGKLVPWAPAASDGSQVPCAILTQPVVATADVRAGVYTGGFFNDAALVWPAHADANSLVKRQAAFARTPIRIGTVRL